MYNIKLSASKLNLLRECPRCFWLAMINNLKRPSGPMSSIPIKMDSIIKHYYNTYRTQNELPPILNGQINGQLAVNMPVTLQWQVEKGIILWGRPDDYFLFQSGATVPFDHKTKSKIPDEVHPAYQLQLDVYSYLLRMNGYKTMNKGILAFYCPDDGDLHNGMTLRCTIRQVITDPNHTISMIRQARNILNKPIPEPGDHCEYCKWTQLLSKNNLIPEATT
jgi:hypothetical protein